MFVIVGVCVWVDVHRGQRHRIPRAGDQGVCESHDMSLGSSLRTVHTLNHWAISPTSWTSSCVVSKSIIYWMPITHIHYANVKVLILTLYYGYTKCNHWTLSDCDLSKFVCWILNSKVNLKLEGVSVGRWLINCKNGALRNACAQGGSFTLLLPSHLENL